jgi:hypothetical protein
MLGQHLFRQGQEQIQKTKEKIAQPHSSQEASLWQGSVLPQLRKLFSRAKHQPLSQG